MKLIIDIPEEMYEQVKDGMWCGNHTIGHALENGIPLDDCDDAVSREDVIKLVECSGYDLQFRSDNADMCDDVRKLSSVTQKSGKWITTRTFMHDGEYYCDRCKCEAPNNEKWDFCPNCGADMKGDAE